MYVVCLTVAPTVIQSRRITQLKKDICLLNIDSGSHMFIWGEPSYAWHNYAVQTAHCHRPYHIPTKAYNHHWPLEYFFHYVVIY